METLDWPVAEGQIIARAERLLEASVGGGRRVLGIAGAPAGGKSTLTDWLVGELVARHPGRVAHIGMDAFHLGQRVLDAHGLAAVKGAPQTFDAAGYAALLERVRTSAEAAYAPVFHREIEDSIAHEAEIGAEVGLVVTEGNYLLLDTPPWDRIRPLLDEAWYVAIDDEERRRRLIARHVTYGRSPAEAAERTLGSDEANARVVAATRVRADLVIQL